MKNNLKELTISADRLATPDEVLAAVLPFPDPIEECNLEILSEIARDIGGYARIPLPDLEASRMVEELIREEDTDIN
ncbi:MAG: hypothetical protein ACRD4Y_09485 [Candidatus Acidiferrales bacterium]